MQTNATAGSPLLERLPAVRPTPQQAAWQDLELGMFVHFGLYAVTGRFTGITWIPEGANPLYSSSPEPVDPGLFSPTDFEAAQWVATAQAGGARYLLLTAKSLITLASLSATFLPACLSFTCHMKLTILESREESIKPS